MPKIHIEGIMTGALAPELSGTTYIRSSSGYIARIDYSCKGWLGGKRNAFVASLYRDGQESKPLYTIEGQWSGEFEVKRMNTGETTEKFDTSALPRTPFTVAPLEKQHPLESRRAWQHVVDGIHKGDIFAVGHEKSKIENEQREMRKREHAEGVEFQMRYFSKVEEDPIAERLSKGVKTGENAKRDVDTYRDLWVWDEDKYKRIQQRLQSGIKSPIRTRFDSGVGGMLLLDTTE